MDNSRIRKYFSSIGLAYFAFAAVTLMVQAAVIFLLRAVGTDVSALGTTARLALSMGSMYLAGFPVFLLLLRRIPRCPVSAEDLRPMTLGQFGICLLICIGVMEGGNLIGNMLMGLTSLFLGRQVDNSVISMVLQGDLIPVILFSAVLAPVFEELMFRRLLIDRIRMFGDRTAIVVSGVLFGLIHGNFYQFFYACGLGMIFAYVYLRTGKVRTTIFLHMCINLLGGVAGTVLLKWISAAGNSVPAALFSTMAMGLYALLLIALAIAGLVLLICLWNRRYLAAGVFEIPASRRFFTVFLNLGMILFFLICVLQFWMNLN